MICGNCQKEIPYDKATVVHHLDALCLKPLEVETRPLTDDQIQAIIDAIWKGAQDPACGVKIVDLKVDGRYYIRDGRPGQIIGGDPNADFIIEF